MMLNHAILFCLVKITIIDLDQAQTVETEIGQDATTSVHYAVNTQLPIMNEQWMTQGNNQKNVSINQFSKSLNGGNKQF